MLPKVTTSLAKKIKGHTPNDRPTLWSGPEEDGITQSLLSRFLCCRERFRLLVVEGLRPAPSFNHRLAYGDMWHLCEEHHAAGTDWQKALLSYCRQAAKEWPVDATKVVHWYHVCQAQFMVYQSHYQKVAHNPLLQEHVFNVKHELPSGRIVRLRGKWDSVDAPTRSTVCLQENKTKGEINEQGLQQQLLFDLQTMFYLVALKDFMPGKKITGVRYNVIRRPLSGGRHSIRQHKPTKTNPLGETSESYYQRLQQLIDSEPEYFFMRWDVTVTDADIEVFKTQFLDPTLEQLCDWWLWVKPNPYTPFREGNQVHYRYPSGVYNPVLEGRAGDLDEYLNTGNKVGLTRATTLFSELELNA